MRRLITVLLSIWIAGCASVETAGNKETASTYVVNGHKASQELELYVYPQDPTSEGYVLRLNY